jgi:DNA-binding XRE family transcriptional regulator
MSTSGKERATRHIKTLREWRAMRDMTQFQLAATAGVGLSSVTNIEAGRQEPRISLAERLAQALGVAVSDIAWPHPEQVQVRRIQRRTRGKPSEPSSPTTRP